MSVTILIASSRKLLRVFRRHVQACTACQMNGGEDARPSDLCSLGVALRRAYIAADIATSEARIAKTEKSGETEL